MCTSRILQRGLQAADRPVEAREALLRIIEHIEPTCSTV